MARDCHSITRHSANVAWRQLTNGFEALYRALMREFKRNQVEGAISRLSGSPTGEPSPELRTRLKRLLETDRSLGRNTRSKDPEQANFAFFSADAPGSGVEVWFSDYEAFALFTAWRLLEHGWPQASAVSIARRARPKLEPKHKEILTWDPNELFDEKKILEDARAGSPAVSTTKPVYLVIASRHGRPVDAESSGQMVEIVDEVELMRFLRSEVGLSATTFELTTAAHELRRMLGHTEPSKRGRGAS